MYPESAAAWWLCFLLTDLLYYVFHRASHYFSWFWGSDIQLPYDTYERQSVIIQAIKSH